MSKKKILFTMFDIQDWGGAAPHIDIKASAFVEAGWQVELVLFKLHDKEPHVSRVSRAKGVHKSVWHPTAHVSSLSGFSGVLCMSMMTPHHIKEWRKFASTFDIVVHEIPNMPIQFVGTIGKGWEKFFDIEPPQILSVHNTRFMVGNPHMWSIAEKVAGAICVNPATYEATALFAAPRALVCSPQIITKKPAPVPAWEDRKRVVLTAHMWYPVKNLHWSVQAAPHLTKAKLRIAGGGIEFHYLTGKKRKPKYGTIWEEAQESGRMSYLGMLSASELHQAYTEARIMLDCHYSEKIAELGSHFNRSVFEAVRAGAVPLVCRESLDESRFQTQILQENETHLAFSASSSPKELAEAMDAAVRMSPKKASEMIRNGQEVMAKFFDRRLAVTAITRLASGKKSAGVYPKLETGKTPRWIREEAAEKVSQAIERFSK